MLICDLKAKNELGDPIVKDKAEAAFLLAAETKVIAKDIRMKGCAIF
jgi:hypothetical protein